MDIDRNFAPFIFLSTIPCGNSLKLSICLKQKGPYWLTSTPALWSKQHRLFKKEINQGETGQVENRALMLEKELVPLNQFLLIQLNQDLTELYH